MMNIFDIAATALSAQSARLNVVASNIANADSVTGADGKPYRAKQVVFAATPMGAGFGVKVMQVVESHAPMRMVATGAALALASGLYVAIYMQCTMLCQANCCAAT